MLREAAMADKPITTPPGLLAERELAALVEASALINASLDLSDTLHAIARAAAEVLDAEASSVLLLDPRRNKLTFLAACGAVGADLLGQEMDASQGIAGRVATSGQPVLVPNVRQDPDFFQGFDEKSRFVTRELLAAPLIHQGRGIGVVEVLNRKGGASFGARDVEVLRIFANLAAIAAANAQLHEGVKREYRGLRDVLQRTPEIVGTSAPLQNVLKLCERVAGTNATVLLLGETGTGKEVCARTIHARSRRAEKPFVAINCAALPETLLESELFGHEAGAFTGATARKLGRFESADGGTLFLDEIGDISGSTQIKLLRVLQEREFVRVGGTKTIACDVRIIAATNRDLKAAMDQGEFREDLFYRLNVFPIHLPPLRQRVDDIPALVAHFGRLSAADLRVAPLGVSAEAMQLLCAYRWTGNIRELRNVIERAVLLCDTREITPAHLPREIADLATALGVGGSAISGAGAMGNGPADGCALAASERSAGAGGKRPGPSAASSVGAYERALLVNALQEHGWNQTQAAQALGLSRDNLRYRIRKYGIKRPAE
jgi:Nif-specific regulatory protein